MSSVDASVCSPDWLALRELADAEARSDELAAYLKPMTGLARDLACGTGAMTRWLAPRLPGITEWVLHDRDQTLLQHARTMVDVPCTLRCTDITELRAADLSDTALVAASAVTDLLTAAELEAITTACRQARCPALLTLNVTGQVQWEPSDPLDAEFATAFNDHQRRTVAGRRLLGPDAAEHLMRAFGDAAITQDSPWRLGSNRAALTEAWLQGWLSAAVDQRPDVARHAEQYRRQRLVACAEGRLAITVGHRDVLYLPDEVRT